MVRLERVTRRHIIADIEGGTLSVCRKGAQLADSVGKAAHKTGGIWCLGIRKERPAPRWVLLNNTTVR